MHHHAHLISVLLVQTGFHHVDQASLELLTSGGPPASASQIAGITGVSHHTRHFFLIHFPYYFASFVQFHGTLSSTRNQGSLEKWLISGLGQEIHKMSLEHLMVPESKELFLKKSLGVCQRNTGADRKTTQWP